MTPRDTVAQGRRSVQARGTLHAIEYILGLDPQSFSKAMTSILEAGIGELVAVHWASFINIMGSWLRWEASCRFGGEDDGLCSELIPEGAGRNSVATTYNTLLKTSVLSACEDLAPGWLLPQWVKWYAYHARRERILSLHRLGIVEQFSRLLDYAVYVYGVHGASKAYLEYYDEKSSIAGATASYIYWDVVDPLYEAIALGVQPLGEEACSILNEASSRIHEWVMARLKGSRPGVRLVKLAVNVSEELRKIVVRELSARYASRSLSML